MTLHSLNFIDVIAKLVLSCIAIALAIVILCASLMGGCTTASTNPQAQTAVEVLYVQGEGAIGVAVYGQQIEAAWREVGVTVDGAMIHCSVVDRLTLGGVSLGSGYLPAPLSDPGCAKVLSPFRAGAAVLLPTPPTPPARAPLVDPGEAAPADPPTGAAPEAPLSGGLL
jgi:hypothetical protein